MSQHYTELCILLVDEFYGGIASTLFSVLASQKRLVLFQIVQLSGLPARLVKHGLAALIQQNLVLHYEEDVSTYYEAACARAYNLIRVGKTAAFIEERTNNKDLEGVFSAFHVLGSGSRLEVQAVVDSHQKSVDASSTSSRIQNDANLSTVPNGAPKKGSIVKSSFSSSDSPSFDIDPLREPGYIVKLQDIDFLPESEFHNRAALLIRETGRMAWPIKGKAKMDEFLGEVKKRKRELRDEAWIVKKPKFSGVPKHKQSRTVSEDDDPEDDMIYRANHEKLDVLLRSQQLYEMSAHCLGDTAALVYKAFLHALEPRMSRCFDPYDEHEPLLPEEDDDDHYVKPDFSPPVSTIDIVGVLGPNFDIGILQHKSAHASGKVKKENRANSEERGLADTVRLNGDIGESFTEETGPPLKELVSQHMRILAEHTNGFVKRIRVQDTESWHVNFVPLTRKMIQTDIENLVTSRFGSIAARILRILYAKGKLDEKQIATLGLIPQKQLRAILTSMQEAGYVDTQEVPRDNSRQPSRTIYLWFYDQDRCRQLMLNDTYKAMSRLLQRTRVEKEKVKAVLDKAERTDVQGREDEFLSIPEQNALKQWRNREERLLVQLNRQDDFVARLRDFLPPVMM